MIFYIDNIINMSNNEEAIKKIMNEIQLIIIDSSNPKLSQKEKINNYKNGTLKIKEVTKLLELVKEDILTMNIETITTVQINNVSNIINTIQTPGNNINEILKSINTLKNIIMVTNYNPKIVENIEYDIITEPKNLDIYVEPVCGVSMFSH